MNTDKWRARFVLCVRNQGSEDLEPRKFYRLLPDRTAMSEGYLRVVDDSGEDYVYPADYFVPVTIPPAVARLLAAPASSIPPPKTSRPVKRRA